MNSKNEVQNKNQSTLEKNTVLNKPEFLSEATTKRAIINLIVYIIFLITIFIITNGMYPPISYRFTQLVELVFIKNFKNILAVDEIWEYLQTVFMDNLYWEQIEAHNITGIYIKKDNMKFLYENKLLGAVRLRQVRVRNNSCEVYNVFLKYFHQCFSYYSIDNEDTSSFGAGVGTAWTYSSEYKLNGSTYWGQLATYGGGGYYEDLPAVRDDAMDALMSLKNLTWLDRGTRVLFVDFTFYNANTNLFCVVKLIFEKSSLGAVITSWSINTINLILYVDRFDSLIFGFQLLYLLLVLYYTMLEIIVLHNTRLLYFTSFWNITNALMIAISYAAIVDEIYLYWELKEYLDISFEKPQEFLDLEEISANKGKIRNALGIFAFLMWLNLFKYLNFNNTMTQLSLTLKKSMKELVSFAFMLLIIFFAYSQLATLLFGVEMSGFSNTGLSIISLFKMMLGEYDYLKMSHSQRVFAPIFFITYVLFVLLVFSNVFLAILTDSYVQIKKKIDAPEEYTNIWKYINKTFHMYCPCLLKLLNKISDRTSWLVMAKNQKDELERISTTTENKDIEQISNIKSPPQNISDRNEIKRLKESIDDSKQSIQLLLRKIDDNYSYMEAIIMAQSSNRNNM